MKNKFIISTTIVLLLIIEAVVILTKQILLEEAADKAVDFSISAPEKLPAVLTKLKTKNLTLTWEGGEKTYTNISELTTKYYSYYRQKDSLRIDFEKLKNVLESLAPVVNQEPVDAKLEFAEKEQKVKEFSLSQNGKKLNIARSMSQIARSLAEEHLVVPLAVDEIPPEITLNSLEKLGIKTLLAKGESDFKGSSSNRIHNIQVGSAKFHGLLLKPGSDFSFNSVLGEVSDKTGYRYELVVKNKKLTPEYGGGICQVSTTLFRAAVLAGLPILERREHSLPVKYYNPQGFDATIYPGVTDLRFTNDTPANILIQTKISGTKLTFEIYGSSDGRKTEVTGPQITEQNPDGSLKTILTRKTVTVDGKIKEEYFKSNYKSPALFPLEKNPLE